MSSDCIGREIIERGSDDRRVRANKAQKLAQEGHDWEPRDRMLQALWQEALLAEGCTEAAELVGWEKLRRVPTDEQEYVQTANTIALLPERRDEAEALVVQEIARFPNNAHGWTSLAEILVVENRLDEPMALLKNRPSVSAANEVTHALFASQHSHFGNKELAYDALHESMGMTGTPALRHDEDLFDSRQSLPLVSRSFEQHFQRNQQPPPRPETSALAQAMRPAKLSQIWLSLETETDARRDEALSELPRILEEEPTFAYAELLAARQGICKAEGHGLPGFASAFEEARRTEDRAAFEQRSQKTHRLKALIRVAQAL